MTAGGSDSALGSSTAMEPVLATTAGLVWVLLGALELDDVSSLNPGTGDGSRSRSSMSNPSSVRSSGVYSDA